MASCYKCGKPVYFAERTLALGKEWHKSCFSCYECGKVLQPGRHTEHKSLPYCEAPCYLALFGPRGYRQGVSSFDSRFSPPSHVDTHKFFIVESPNFSAEMDNKLTTYNAYYADNDKLLVSKSKVDGQTVLEGSLKIYWGIERPIRFQQKDETLTIAKFRHSSYCVAVSNDDDNEVVISMNDEAISPPAVQTPSADFILDLADASHENCGQGFIQEEVVMRRRIKKRRGSKRLSIINGHLYNADTNIFVPQYGSVTNVTVTSNHTCPQVIKLLLDKFKVENCPDEYCLCVVKYNGATHALPDLSSPLLERLELGPREDDAKLFIFERLQAFDIPQEVAQFYNLPEAVLHGFLEKIYREEEREIEWIKERYKYRQIALIQRITDLTAELTGSSDV